MFDDSKRLDKLEAQMAGVEKSIAELRSALDGLSKSSGEKFKALDFQNEDKDRQFAGIRKSRLEPLETDSKTLNDAVKKLQQRCTNLEAAVKKLSK